MSYEYHILIVKTAVKTGAMVIVLPQQLITSMGLTDSQAYLWFTIISAPLHHKAFRVKLNRRALSLSTYAQSGHG